MTGVVEPKVIAIFGPTAAGKTGIALALSELLRSDGIECIAINSDSMQVYRGLEILSAAPSRHERARLNHRLVGIVDPAEEFSVGGYAPLAHAEIDSALAGGKCPLIVGGTGLYTQAAIRDLELLPPVPDEIRREVESELEERGTQQMHAELSETDRARMHPNDRKRIARVHELRRAGIEPHRDAGGLWAGELRHPTAVFGITMPRPELHARIAERVERMVSAGAFEEAQVAERSGLSRTARAMIGIDAALAEDSERLKRDHRRYARRQLTWMRKMAPMEILDRSGRQDSDLAAMLRRSLVG